MLSSLSLKKTEVLQKRFRDVGTLYQSTSTQGQCKASVREIFKWSSDHALTKWKEEEKGILSK